jgi:L-asparagine transporter-like permease
MPLLSLYLIYVITTLPFTIWSFIDGAHCSMRQHTHQLNRKRTKYRLAKTYRGRYWLFLLLMVCSFCCSLHWSDAHPRMQSLCCPPTTNKDRSRIR